jgi:raffinose/stachyose/melibiose transport system substrate-binding protein
VHGHPPSDNEDALAHTYDKDFIVETTRYTRRSFVGIGLGALTAAGLAACGAPAPGGSGSGASKAAGSGAATIWSINSGLDAVFKKSVADFNKANPKTPISLQLFQDNPFKQKLRVAIASNSGPDLFFGWGGGILGEYVDAGKVEDLTPMLDSTPGLHDKFFKNVLDTASFDGKVYGVPVNGMQAVVLFYNKEVFDKAGVRPPKTYDDLLELVKVFNGKKIIPIALGGADKWPDLMYEEYFVDRVGGAEIFQAVLDGKKDAWLDPAFVKANTLIQDLVTAGAFPKSFGSISYDTGQASALLYTGKAAMQVQGGWNYATILKAAPDFIKQGKLGWVAFPALAGGAGDPANIAGNPSNYYSLTSASKAKDTAKEYLKTMWTDEYIDGELKSGAVPPLHGLESKIAAQGNGDWLNFMYKLIQDAPNFTQSWDQALPPSQADALLTNLDQLFLKQITPQQFSKNMNAAAKGK